MGKLESLKNAIKIPIWAVDKKLLGGRIRSALYNRKPNLYNPNYYAQGQNYPYRGYEALEKLLSGAYTFETVLDIGCGEGTHSEILLRAGKKVTGIDWGESIYFKKNRHNPNIETIVNDINTWDTERQFDCIWCSHVLEHQPNVNLFLKKINSLLKPDGILAITVPPLSSVIGGGHVSFWNAGLLLYNLVLAGFDCSDASIKTYCYDISVIIKKRNIKLPSLLMDYGEIELLKPFLPKNLLFDSEAPENYFEGNIEELNWR